MKERKRGYERGNGGKGMVKTKKSKKKVKKSKKKKKEEKRNALTCSIVRQIS